MGDLFGVLDFDWIARQLTGGNPVPFLLWTAFVATVGFFAGRRWRRREERKEIDEKLGKIDEFSRVRTLSDLIDKSDELAQSASAEVMVERTQRISDLEDKVARQALEIDAKAAEIIRIKSSIAAAEAGELDRLRDENAELSERLSEEKARCLRMRTEVWLSERKKDEQRRRNKSMFAKLSPYEAKYVRAIHSEGPMPEAAVPTGVVASLLERKVIQRGNAPGGAVVFLADPWSRALNSDADLFEELFPALGRVHANTLSKKRDA